MNKANTSIACTRLNPKHYVWFLICISHYRQVMPMLQNPRGQPCTPLPAHTRWLTSLAGQDFLPDCVKRGVCPFPHPRSQITLGSLLYAVKFGTSDPYPLPSGVKECCVKSVWGVCREERASDKQAQHKRDLFHLSASPEASHFSGHSIRVYNHFKLNFFFFQKNL